MAQQLNAPQAQGKDPGGRVVPRQSDLEMLDRVNARLEARRSPA